MVLMVIVLGITAPARFGAGDSTGAALYRAWCSQCHGVDARGVPQRQTRLSTRPANLADCRRSTAETERGWIDVVREGGAAFGLSLDMPGFGDAATPEQIRAVVQYIRSLCGERAWPPGELNFPRTFFAEKAYPENEVVVTTHGNEQEWLYERRFGPRFQIEASVRTIFDSLSQAFGGATAAVKYNVWYSNTLRSIASVGIEASPDWGRQDAWEVEPYVAFGTNPTGVFYVQGEFAASWEESQITGFPYALSLSREVGRFAPMVEIGGTIARLAGDESTLSIVPQLWFRLSRLGHVAGSVGVDFPMQEPRSPLLVAFLLWDYADAGLFRGW